MDHGTLLGGGWDALLVGYLLKQLLKSWLSIMKNVTPITMGHKAIREI